jgi:hypothetical protein
MRDLLMDGVGGITASNLVKENWQPPLWRVRVPPISRWSLGGGSREAVV